MRIKNAYVIETNFRQKKLPCILASAWKHYKSIRWFLVFNLWPNIHKKVSQIFIIPCITSPVLPKSFSYSEKICLSPAIQNSNFDQYFLFCVTHVMDQPWLQRFWRSRTAPISNQGWCARVENRLPRPPHLWALTRADKDRFFVFQSLRVAKNYYWS